MGDGGRATRRPHTALRPCGYETELFLPKIALSFDIQVCNEEGNSSILQTMDLQIALDQVPTERLARVNPDGRSIAIGRRSVLLSPSEL